MKALARPTFYVPAGELTGPVLRDALGLVGESLPDDWVLWTPLEAQVVCDWAMREHLHASDVPVQRRPRPSLLGYLSD